MRATTLTLTTAFVVLGCTAEPPRYPLSGTSRTHTSVDLAGTFVFSSTGDLLLTLANPCTMTPERESQGRYYCDRKSLDALQVKAMLPWQSEIRGIWIDATHLAFRVDWKACGLDPLADDAADLVTRPWMIAGTHWTPTFTEAQQILRLVAEATDTETELIRGGNAPSLEITSFEIRSAEGATGALHAGGEDEIVVKIANRGVGTAYRVTTTTRSSIASLHGKRLSFGMISPGAEKTRHLRVSIPAFETAPDTMLVLVPAEGNGFTPRNLSRRFAITASKATPVLAVHCSIFGHTGKRPELDAGDDVTLKCVVDNRGTASATVDLETSVAGRPSVHSTAQIVSPAGHVSFDVPISIPADLAINSNVEIATTAHARKTPRTAHAQVIGVIGKPRVCRAGTLTRAEYNAKVAAMRAAMASGGLRKDAFDRYDAELVTCMR